MQFKNILLVFMFLFTFLSVDYKAETANRCSASILAKMESDGKDREKLREDYKVNIGMNVEDFKKIFDK